MLNILSNKQFRITSPLSPKECYDRLSAAIDYESFRNPFSFRSTRLCAGEVTTKFLYLRKQIFGRNPFQTIIVASISNSDAGTLIDGVLCIHPGLKKLLKIWSYSSVLIGYPVLYSIFHELLLGSIKLEDLSSGSFDTERFALLVFPGVGILYFFVVL